MPQSTYSQQEVDQIIAGQAAVLSAHASQIASLDTRLKKLEGAPPVVTPPPVDPPPTPGRFFAATSSWNTKIPTTATYTDVAGLHQGGGWANYDSNSVPVATTKSTDPLVTVHAPASWGWPDAQIPLHLALDVIGGGGGDNSLCAIDGGKVYSFWQFNRNGATASAASYAIADLSGDGWATSSTLGAGTRSAGCSILAGTIVGNELTTGINHAVAVQARSNLVGPPIPPAISSDGSGGPIPMGARLGIPRATGVPTSLTAQGKTLWKACVDYGMFVIDTIGGDPHAGIINLDPRSVPQADANALLSAPNWTAADLGAIFGAIKRVN